MSNVGHFTLEMLQGETGVALKLNLIQKAALALFGATILVVQVATFLDDGVRGVGWVFALLVSALLLLPIMTELHRLKSWQRHPKGRSQPSPAMKEFMDFHALQASVAPLSKEVETRAASLHAKLDELMGFKAEVRMTAAYIDLYEHVHQYCLAYCYGLACLVEGQKDASFLGSQRQKMLMALVGKLMLTCIKGSMTKIGAGDAFNEDKQRPFVIADLTAVEKAVTYFVGGLVSGSPKPDTELIRFLVDHVSVPDEQLPKFAVDIQEYTKQTMAEMAKLRRATV